MDEGLLSNTTRDVLAVFGALGTVATLTALAIAIWQIVKTKAIAIAAREAATSATDANRRQFSRYVVSNANRLLQLAKIYVDAQEWRSAALRVSDLAEQVDQIAQVATLEIGSWTDLAGDLRGWEDVFRALVAGKKAFARNKWNSDLRRISGMLAAFHGPFAIPEQGNEP